MKHLFTACTLTILMMVLSGTASANEGMNDRIIPQDKDVVIGRLENGMTYYIWHNEKPKGCADFYIVHNVGALQEDDNQNGLAHFLEHMAFNGTKHFPDKELFGFLSKEGVRFGANINAYTSRNETVYNLSSIPLVRESFIDSVLLVLHDWSTDISCELDALNAERGVISEEWRRRDDSRTRMALKQNDLIYRGSKQAQRSVIGTLEVINGFKREEILDFYDKWYRPDLQAIVIVGDIDVRAMEKKVISSFSDIPARENPTPKEVFMVPDLEEPLMEDMTDSQIKYQTLKVIHRQAFPSWEERSTYGFVKDALIRDVLTNAVEMRLKEAVKSKDCPAKSAVIVTNQYSSEFYITLFTISPRKEDHLEELLTFYTDQMNSLKAFGLSEDEVENAIFTSVTRLKLDKEYSDKDIADKDLVNVCKEHFLRGYPCILPSEMKRIQKSLIEEITPEEVNAYISKMFTDSQMIYAYSCNESKKEILPGKERMKEIIAQANAKEPQKRFLTFEHISLEVDVPQGRIVKTSPVRGTQSEVWELDNGAKVYWTPSDEVQSPVHFAATYYFDTGYAAFDQEKIGASKSAVGYMSRYMGFRGADRSRLHSMPSCSGVDLTTYFKRDMATISVLSNKKNAQKALAMAYLQLTEPYMGEKVMLDHFVENNLSALGKTKTNQQLFKEKVRDVRFGKHPWAAEPDSSDVMQLDQEFLGDVFRRSFSGTDRLSVYICSDLDKETVQNLVCQYIASLKLPENKAIAKVKPTTPCYKGKIRLDEKYPLESAPKSVIEYNFRGKTKLDTKSLLCFDILDYIMSFRYINQIREARGGTYSVSFSTEIRTENSGVFESTVSFQTRPEMKDILVGDVENELRSLALDGPEAEEMDAAVKYLSKYHREIEENARESVSSGNMKLIRKVEYGIDEYFDYDRQISRISSKDVQMLAKKILNSDSFCNIYNEE